MVKILATYEKDSRREVMNDEAETVYKLNISEPDALDPGRNFFVLLDGTWNEERGKGANFVPSNVRKLYNALQSDSPTQIARYFRGVGSAQDNGPLKRWWYGFNGEDERRIRESAYATINKEFRPGDKLFILGFSRGAACARRLASDLANGGIYETIRIRTRMVANRITDQVEARFVGFEHECKSEKKDVSFLGCWDTVGAFVLPLRFPNHPWLDWIARKWTSGRESWNGNVPFRDLTVASNVQRAVHCVAIDETRNAFLPTLMNRESKVDEVWFPGVHADVGGGYLAAPLVLAALLFVSPASGHQLTGRVVAVADGDTITVLDAAQRQTRVRLSGIDAPEKKQPYGTRAKQHLAGLVFGKMVEVDWEKHDRYGRIIGTVLAPDVNCAATDCAKTVDAGLAQLSAGLAWHYKQYAKEQPRVERERYAAAEQAARLNRLGVWADPYPTAPWEWRRPRRH